jgi:hypothetical protein
VLIFHLQLRIWCLGWSPGTKSRTSAMASNNHQPPRPSLPMSYSQSSIGSTNGMAFSQSQMGSFNASQSVASTPRATPPPKGSQQSAMSFNYTNGLHHSSRGSFGGFEDMNGYGTMVPYKEDFKPQIYRVRHPFLAASANPLIQFLHRPFTRTCQSTRWRSMESQS